MAELTINSMQTVTPNASVITATRANKNGRRADQCAFALNGGAEDFGNTNVVVIDRIHDLSSGRYSAHVLGVSLTFAALVSGNLALHQS